MILGLNTISSAKISPPKFRGICPTVLLSLTLLLGFISVASLNYNQERQPAPTELVLKRSSSPRRRMIVNPITKKHFTFVFFLSCQEIVRRLMLYDRRVMVEHSENLKPEALDNRLKIQLLALALGNSKLSDSYLLRG